MVIKAGIFFLPQDLLILFIFTSTITVIVHIHVPTETYYVTKTVDDVLVQSKYAGGMHVDDVSVHQYSFFN